MKRDKIVSVRVNSNLLNRVKEIIDKNTEVNVYYNHKYYNCKIGLYRKNFFSNKLNISDILENALLEFVEKYK